jgi:hypothetical protein
VILAICTFTELENAVPAIVSIVILFAPYGFEAAVVLETENGGFGEAP